MIKIDTERFIKAQDRGDSYNEALSEIKHGYKRTHWIGYVFPQMKGLEQSEIAKKYAINSLIEAKAYMEDDTLGHRLREITQAILDHAGYEEMTDMMSRMDAVKIRSCMTLFDIVSSHDIFAEVLDKFYEGGRCEATLNIVKEECELYCGENVFSRNGIRNPRGLFEHGIVEAEAYKRGERLATILDLMQGGTSMEMLTAAYLWEKDFSYYRLSGVESNTNHYRSQLIRLLLKQVRNTESEELLTALDEMETRPGDVWYAAEMFDKAYRSIMGDERLRQIVEDYVHDNSVIDHSDFEFLPKYTPDNIIYLTANEVFVFGSNLAGEHGGGAARMAYNKFGAVWGKGVGHYGRTYAIPTMQGGVETIKPYVDDFILYAQNNPHLLFYVTRIGCGIAGFKDADIAPLFADAVGIRNIVLPKSFVDILETSLMPKHLRPKVYGQTRTMVDMLIAMNKDAHFSSAQEAFDALFSHLGRLAEGCDKIAFNCSWRSINAFVDKCFENGALNVDKLHKECIHHCNNPLLDVYADYVAERTAVIVSYMNEFRRYTNREEVLEDFVKATGGVNHCGPNPDNYYFAIDTFYIRHYFKNYLHQFWDEMSTNGVLDNRKFRDFMIERHERGIKKYGLENVIKRNFKSDGPCHPEVYFPYRGGAAPVYVKDEKHRRYIKSCGEGKGPRRISDYFEFNLVEPLLREDSKYTFISNFYLPKEDYTLPVYGKYDGRIYFDSEEEKLAFIKKIKDE